MDQQQMQLAFRQRIQELLPGLDASTLNTLALLHDRWYCQEMANRALAQALFECSDFDRYAKVRARQRALLDAWGFKGVRACSD